MVVAIFDDIVHVLYKLGYSQQSSLFKSASTGHAYDIVCIHGQQHAAFGKSVLTSRLIVNNGLQEESSGGEHRYPRTGITDDRSNAMRCLHRSRPCWHVLSGSRRTSSCTALHVPSRVNKEKNAILKHHYNPFISRGIKRTRSNSSTSHMHSLSTTARLTPRFHSASSCQSVLMKVHSPPFIFTTCTTIQDIIVFRTQLTCPCW